MASLHDATSMRRCRTYSMVYLSSDYGRPASVLLDEMDIKSEEDAQNLLQSAKASNNHALELRALEALGLLNLGSNSKKAEGFYLQGLGKAQTKLEELHFCGRLGALFVSYGKSDAWSSVLERVVGLVKRCAEPESMIPIYFLYGCVCLQFHELDRATEFCHIAIELSQPFNNINLARDCYHLLGEISQVAMRPAKTLEAYEKALELAIESGDKKHIVRDYNLVAEVHRSLRAFDSAIQSHEKALAVAMSSSSVTNEAECCGCIGAVYSLWGRYEDAMQWHQREYTLYEQVADFPSLLKASNSLAYAYWQCDMPEKATEFFLASLKLAARQGNFDAQLESVSNVGRVESSNGFYNEARRFHQKQLELASRANNKVAEAKALGNLGNDHEGEGNVDIAQKYYSLQLNCASNVDDHFIATKNIVRLYLTYHQHEQVRVVLENHRHYLERAGAKSAEPRFYYLMGVTAVEQKSTQAALSAFHKQIAAAEDVKNVEYIGMGMCSIALLNFKGRLYEQALELVLKFKSLSTTKSSPFMFSAANYLIGACQFANQKKDSALQALTDSLLGFEHQFASPLFQPHPSLSSLCTMLRRTHTLLALTLANFKRCEEAMVLQEMWFFSNSHGRWKVHPSWVPSVSETLPSSLCSKLSFYALLGSANIDVKELTTRDKGLLQLVARMREIYSKGFGSGTLSLQPALTTLLDVAAQAELEARPDLVGSSSLDHAYSSVDSLVADELPTDPVFAKSLSLVLEGNELKSQQFQAAIAKFAEIARNTASTFITYLFDPIDSTQLTCCVITANGSFHSHSTRGAVDFAVLVESAHMTLASDPHATLGTFPEVTSLDMACETLNVDINDKEWLESRIKCQSINDLCDFLIYEKWESCNIKRNDPIGAMKTLKIICRKCCSAYVWSGIVDDESLDCLLSQLGFDGDDWIVNWLLTIGWSTTRTLKTQWRELHCISNTHNIATVIESLVNHAPEMHRYRLRKMLGTPFDAFIAMRTLHDYMIFPLLPWLPTPSSSNTAPSLVIIPTSILKDLPFNALVNSNGVFLIEMFEVAISSSIMATGFCHEKLDSIRLNHGDEGREIIHFAPKPSCYVVEMKCCDQVIQCETANADNLRNVLQGSNGRKVVMISTQLDLNESSHSHPHPINLLDPVGAFHVASSSTRSRKYPSDQLLYLAQFGTWCLSSTEMIYLDVIINDRGGIDHDLFTDGLYKRGLSSLSRSILLSGVPQHVLPLWSVDSEVSAVFGALLMYRLQRDDLVSLPASTIFRQSLLYMLSSPELCRTALWAPFTLKYS